MHTISDILPSKGELPIQIDSEWSVLFRLVFYSSKLLFLESRIIVKKEKGLLSRPS